MTMRVLVMVNISYYVTLMLVSLILRDNGKIAIALGLLLLIYIYQMLWISYIILPELLSVVLTIKL